MRPLWTAGGSLGVFLHALHYGLIVFGLVGVVLLLLPHRLAARRRHLRPLDEHERRVAELRASLAGGTPAATLTQAPPAPPPAPPRSRTLLPLAVTSSAAAAAVHAALGPAHFEEGLWLGLFFAVSSTLQLGWSVLGLTTGGTRLLQAGVVLNAGCVALWAVTRTLGLPFGLLPGPEEVGPWDLCTVAWELVVVACCARALRRTTRHPRAARWDRWTSVPQAWLVLSVVVLTVLSLTAERS